MRSIDFRHLSLRDAIDLAILVEEEAKDRYEELASQMEMHGNGDVARFFLQMVQVELTHERQLMNRRLRLFGHEPATVPQDAILEVEAPSYEDARATMTVRAALGMALAGECKAHAFFDAALKELEDPEVRELFTDLREEEVEHQRLVRERIAKLPPEPIVSNEDVADAPVAQ